MTDSAQDLAKQKAQQLLDAQVQFFLKDLTPERLTPIVREEAQYLYEQLADIRLQDAVSEQKIATTAHVYATEMEIGGAIPELFGEIAHIVYELPANKTTRIGDAFSDDIAKSFLEKIFEPNSLLDQAVNNIRTSEPFKLFLADVGYIVLKSFLLEENQILKKNPPLAKGVRFLSGLVTDRIPTFKERLEEQTHQLLENSVSNALNLVHELLDQDRYRDSAHNSTLTLWDQIKAWPIDTFQDFFSELDLQELLVLGYEFWLEFRHSDYLQACIHEGVSFFFTKYGDESLQSVMLEMGVTRDMILSEAENYAPDVANLLLNESSEGIAETILRRHLHRFYFDQATLELLQTQ